MVTLIERVKDLARSNTGLAAGLNVAMDVMVEPAESCNRDILRFRV
jgi:hypothetical protein